MTRHYITRHVLISLSLQPLHLSQSAAMGLKIPQHYNLIFSYINAWSSPATWGCSSGTFEDCATAPNQLRDLVEIPSDTEILLDVSTQYLSVLLIRGALIWDTEVGQ